MPGKQKSLFADGLFGGPGIAGLVPLSQPDRPLTSAQRSFARLVARIEELRARLDRETRRLDAALAYYGKHLSPRIQRQTVLRKDIVRAFAPFLDKKRLKRGNERERLRTIIAEQMSAIVQEQGSLSDGDLREIFHQIYGVDFEQAERQEMEEARSAMEEMFDDFGIAIDLSDLKPDMSAEELAAKAAEMAEEIQREAEDAERAARRPDRRKTKRQLEKDERMLQAEQLRKKSIGTIYKQLAKILHPDLEQDSGRRQSKVILMQELTAAYRNNDLHTLLRLELVWIQREEGDVARLTEEKLAIYNVVLKEQVVALERELSQLPCHPRYQPIVALNGPFGVLLETDGPAEARLLDKMIAAMEGTLTRMRTGDPLDEVRGVIREHRAARRNRCWSPEGAPF